MKCLSLVIAIYSTIVLAISISNLAPLSVSYKLLPRGSPEPPLTRGSTNARAKRKTESSGEASGKGARPDRTESGSPRASPLNTPGPPPTKVSRTKREGLPVQRGFVKRPRPDHSEAGSQRPRLSNTPDARGTQARIDAARSRSVSPTKSAALAKAEENVKQIRNRINTPWLTDPTRGSDEQLVNAFRKDQSQSKDMANAYQEAAGAARAAGRADRVQRNQIKSAAANADSRLSEALAQQVSGFKDWSNTGSGGRTARRLVRQRQKEYQQLRRNGGKDTDSGSTATPSFDYGSESDSGSTLSIGSRPSPV